MKNIFVMGLDPFNFELLKTIGGGEEYRFHTVFEPSEVVRPKSGEYPSLDDLRERTRTRFAREAAMPGRSLEAVT